MRMGDVWIMGSSHHRDGIVVEYSRHIFRGKLVGRVADEETGLADCTISDDDTSASVSICPAFSRVGVKVTRFEVCHGVQCTYLIVATTMSACGYCVERELGEDATMSGRSEERV